MRIKALLAAAVFAVVTVCSAFCGLSASAESYTALLGDEVDFLTDDEERELYAQMTAAAESSKCNIALIIADSTSGMTERAFTEKILDDSFGISSDSVVLFLAANLHSDHDDWVSCSGKCDKPVGEHSDKLLDAVYGGLESGGWFGAGTAYVSAVSQMMGDSGNTDPVTAPAFAAVLNDEDGVLTDAEKTELLAIMLETANSIECNIGVVITDDQRGKSSKKYADDYLDNAFGFGSSSIVLLYSNDKSSESYVDYISTCGRGTDVYDSQIDRIFDEVYDGLGTDNYYRSIIFFCTYLDSHKSSADFNTPYAPVSDYDSDLDTFLAILSFFLPLAIIAAVIAIVVTTAVSRGYKKKAPISAANYLDNSVTRFSVKNDIFLREFTTHHTHSSSSGGGGHHSGGGGHHSSSHSSHGGGGGRHR